MVGSVHVYVCVGSVHVYVCVHVYVWICVFGWFGLKVSMYMYVYRGLGWNGSHSAFEFPRVGMWGLHTYTFVLVRARLSVCLQSYSPFFFTEIAAASCTQAAKNKCKRLQKTDSNYT